MDYSHRYPRRVHHYPLEKRGHRLQPQMPVQDYLLPREYIVGPLETLLLTFLPYGIHIFSSLIKVACY